MVSEFSEPNGFFLSENFVSNETEWQTILPSAMQLVAAGSAYLGVGPEQNFTYIAALRPRIAFITDIRRQNLIQHLMYKALFELSADRADFLARLFSRSRPAGLDTASDAAALATAFAGAKPDTASYALNVDAVLDVLVDRHGFELSRVDSATLKSVYGVFFSMGPEISYSSTSSTRPCTLPSPCTYQSGTTRGVVSLFQRLTIDSTGRVDVRRDSAGRPVNDTIQRPITYSVYLGAGFATFASLMTTDDGAGVNRGWLATEANYRWLRDFQRRNLIVPVVGDFAGPKALRSVGTWLRENGARVGAFYTSNVEQYLFQGGVEKAFYENVGTLPFDSNSIFIRSFPNAFRALLPQRRPGPRLTQTVTPIGVILDAYKAGQLRTYTDLGNFARP